MNNQSFASAPHAGEAFQKSAPPLPPLKHDAAEWEPTEESEQPSEKHLEPHLRPGGMLEYEVHAELDQATRKRIAEAQQARRAVPATPDEKELDFSDRFEKAAQSMEASSAARDQEPFETGRRFIRSREREQGIGDRDQ